MNFREFCMNKAFKSLSTSDCDLHLIILIGQFSKTKYSVIKCEGIFFFAGKVEST